VTEEADLTSHLQAWVGGDPEARKAAMELTYEELRKIAKARLRNGLDTINATGLVHEAFLRLNDQRRVEWKNRAQFFAVAARLMRRILIDRHRANKALKRGGAVSFVTLSDEAAGGEIDLEVLDRAVDSLALQDTRQARIVELRYFGGLTIEETAEAVEISIATVKREWMVARAWLKREILRA
jgi:RNA polymerase sigma factor (TIGR02999 family)